MRIGVINSLNLDRPQGIFGHIKAFGLTTCQLCMWSPTFYTDEIAERVIKESKESGVTPCAVWAGYSGPAVWNFTQGPTTLGLVPYAYRKQRIAELKKGADFAKKIGAPAIITHCGFIPENMTDYTYRPVVDAIGEVAQYCKDQGIGFWFETGQETPVVLLRVIQDIGTGNLGLNLDPANLILYGKGNPCDALSVFGQYVRNIHVKDGMAPIDGRNLGHEVQVGKGMVNFPRFVKLLKELNFDGEWIIEREIQEGAEQTRDILETVNNLKLWWNA